jgi:hypothetical protein
MLHAARADATYERKLLRLTKPDGRWTYGAAGEHHDVPAAPQRPLGGRER